MTAASVGALLHADAVAVLTAWLPPDRQQAGLRDAYLEHLAANPDGLWRESLPAHLTSSALVLDHDRERALLTLHPKVGRWLQLGGHCERTDRTLAGAALREAVEESGIANLNTAIGPARLDRHPVRCGGPTAPPAWHLDVQYVVVAPPDATHVRGVESDDLAWWPLDGLPADDDRSVRDLASCARLVVERAAP